jgi:DNA-binding NtrC family response regulator
MIAAEPSARLSVSLSEGFTVELPLGLREVRIGRSRDAELQLPDPSVSRLHARIFRVGSRYFLADTSRNGTFVDGGRIRQHQLSSGTCFTVGPYRIHFHQDESFGREAEPVTLDGEALPPPAAAAGLAECPPAPPSHPQVGAASSHRPDTSCDTYGIIGYHPDIIGLIETIRKAAPSDVPVLVEGETGCGKELVSRALHDGSRRCRHPYVVVNCGAISAELIESELFGHEKGAFTGATAMRKGAFETAHGGTLFLDEVGELPLALQPKLLRVLEQKEIKRVGGNDTIAVDVRIVAATNRDLKDEVARRAFRDDLYFRIGAITLALPPLRERREDIPVLAGHFLSLSARALGVEPRSISPDALSRLVAHDWPGNARELRNAVQRALVMGEGDTLSAADFAFLDTAAGEDGRPSGEGLAEPLSRWEESERTRILSELSRLDWNKTAAARSLGIAKSTLFEKLRKYAIRTPPSGR